MAQYIYLQDDSASSLLAADNNVQIINTSQQVMTPTGDGNVFVYHQAPSQTPQNSNMQAGHFQQQQQQTPPAQRQQWGQVIYATAPPQQQQQSPMNVILNMQPRQVTPTQYMKMVTVNASSVQHQQQQQTVMMPRITNANARPQMVPVILNPGFRPSPPASQSVIIHNQQPPVLRPTNVTIQQSHSGQQQQGNNVHTQQVIIDPRAFMQMQQQQQSVAQQSPGHMQQPDMLTASRQTLQYRLVQSKPVGQSPTTTGMTGEGNQTVRHTRPVNPPQPTRTANTQQPTRFTNPQQLKNTTVILNSRAGTRPLRPQVRLVSSPGGLRLVRPGTITTQTRPARPVNSTQQTQEQQVILQTPTRVVATTSADKKTIIRKAAPCTGILGGSSNSTYSPVVSQRPLMRATLQHRLVTPPPQPTWKPMVEVRTPQPSAGGGDPKTDDDIENSLSTAILHRAHPQTPVAMNEPGPSQQHQQQQNRGPPASVDIAALHTDVINTRDSSDTAKMLVILPDEERRLITFTLPTESCTVIELLEQVGIDLTPNMQIRCIAIADDTLDYVVTITEEKRQPTVISTPVVQQRQQTPLVAVQATSGIPPPPAASHRKQKLTPVVDRPATASPAPPPHVPKLIEGYMAICGSCGWQSMDHSRCERCHRVLSSPQKKPVKPISPPVQAPRLVLQQQPQVTMSSAPIRMATPISGKVSRGGALRGRASRGRGGPAGTPAGSGGRGRGSRAPKVEEPVVLTLSSDEDEEDSETKETSNGTEAMPRRYPFEPVYMDEGGGGDGTAMELFPDEERRDVCSEIGAPGSVNTSLEVKELRFGSYTVPISTAGAVLVSITHLGIKFVWPKEGDKKDSLQTLNIQKEEIMKLAVHYGAQLPVIFLYTRPACGKYIRNELKMSSVLQMPPRGSSDPLPAYYDPANNIEAVKRIVIVASMLRGDTRNAIKLVFPKSKYDEISWADAMGLLKMSRAGGGVSAEAAGMSNKRSSAMVAAATIKRYAGVEADEKAATRDGGERASESANLSQPLGDSSQDIHKLMIYPPQGKGGISINTEDYQCLAVDQYLNDVIIDFYLKYLYEEVMTVEQRAKTHIFSSFFYKRLTATSARQRHLERELKMTPAQKRHNRVKSWTKNVNLFDKDFIIIPINELSHWFLAVICFPGLEGPRSAKTGQAFQLPLPQSKKGGSAPGLTKQAVKEMEKRKSGLMSVTIGNTTITPVGKREENIYVNEETLSERDEAEGDESDFEDDEEEEEAAAAAAIKLSQEQQREPIHQPCILVFDSLRGTVRSRVTATLREYLTCEYANRKAEKAPERIYDKDSIKGHNAKVPQQNNFTDCGLFVLQYVEEMIRNPIGDFKLPMKALKTWFNTQKVTRKREDIALLIRKLLEKQHTARVALLPDIDFPTVNGEPVEPEKPSTPERIAQKSPEAAPKREEEDEGADSEDLFDEIENTVVDECDQEALEEGSNGSVSSDKKVTKLMIPSLKKRKSSMEMGSSKSKSKKASPL